MKYSETDLKILYDAKTLFYEIGHNDQPVKHSNIVGDNHGNLLHIGIRDGEYNICYYIFVGDGEVEECIAGQKLLLKILNNGNIEPIEPSLDTENIFNQLSESEEKHQPKLYLRFESAIENDTIGISQLNKILYIIGLEYPETKWFRGNEAASFNPFTDYEDGEIADQIRSLTIGYWPDLTDRITYGQWDDNDEGYTNAIDGWEWYKERDINLDVTNSIFDSLTEGKKKKKEKKEYKPKLNLSFDPPIMDGEEFHRIMIAIEARYPKVRWIGGNLDEKPTAWNPFKMVGTATTKETEENGVHLIIVGNDESEKNELSYSCGDYKTNYETKDGWKWYNKKGYVDTESIFDSLNESESNTIPNITFSFEPPIEEPEELKMVLYVLNTIYPGLEWVNSESVLTYDIYNEVFHDTSGPHGDKWPDVVGGLSIGHFEENPNQLSWSSYADPSEHKNLVDGWKFVEEHSIDTESIFNQLNESTRQPKLNLRFEDGISDANELDKVLKVLEIVYPGLTWLGNDPVGTHNVIRNSNEEDFLYDPIYYLTIGYFSYAPDKLTYTSGPDDDIDLADEEQHNYNWVEGWQWVRDNEINYDETTDIFNQLNESYDFLKTTSLIGYSFKAVSSTDSRYWIIRHVFNDKDGHVTVTMEYSKTWLENIGIEGFPTTKTIEKDKVIDFVNSGKWEIVGLPVDNNTFDTFDIFDKLNESKYFFIRL